MLSINQLTTYFAIALFAVLSNEFSQALSSRIDVPIDAFDLTWISKQSKFDFIFESDVLEDIHPKSDSANQTQLDQDPRLSATLSKNGSIVCRYILKGVNDSIITFEETSSESTKGRVTIHNYCSTHWNPPIHTFGSGCRHSIEWHSPYHCHMTSRQDSINQERPCYVYDSKNNLIDLTPLILSNGSSYEVDTKNFSDIKNFKINVCNEAHSDCGPNVASCYGTVESGYNNLTTIDYDESKKAVQLTSLGQHNNLCPDGRSKTVIRFLCDKDMSGQSKPMLVESSECEQMIKWPTMIACPVSDIRAPATDCAIKYEPMKIDIDLRTIIDNRDSIEVALGSESQGTMILGLCSGISPKVRCQGKQRSTVSACLIQANESQIVGSILKSHIRLGQDRLYLESFAHNRTCSSPMGDKFNSTAQIGTRIEFVCSEKNNEPVFEKYENCVYIFKWGSTVICDKLKRDTLTPEEMKSSNQTMIQNPLSHSTKLEEAHTMAAEKHQITVNDTAKIISDSHYSIEKTALSNGNVSTYSSTNISGGIGTVSKEKSMGGLQIFNLFLVLLAASAMCLTVALAVKRIPWKAHVSRINLDPHLPRQHPYSRLGDLNDIL